MDRIQILDEETTNQIAAGEVVERPASVVKELVENSLDARSRHLMVEVEAAGTRLIRVVDDGHGMSRRDLLLSIQRHATSKLGCITDLEKLQTLGFRGEALPSIAAVSQLEITTRRRNEASGHRLYTGPGKEPTVKPVGAAPGTTVIVRDLFANVPARRKHLRSPATEFNHVSRICYALALGHPGVAFRLVHNHREVLQTPGDGNMINSIGALFGADFARKLIETEQASEVPFTLRAYLGPPSQARTNRDHQYVFINQRYIRSPLSREAVETAYRGLLPRHRFPTFFLYLDADGASVDINVHPTKEQARFSRERALRQGIFEHVRRALDQAELIPEVRPDSAPSKQEKAEPREPDQDQQDVFRVDSLATNDSRLYPNREDIKALEPNALFEKYWGWPGFHQQTPARAEQLPEELQPAKKPALGNLRALTQVDNSYIIAQGDDGLYIIDQHAAHERLMYEQFWAAVTSEDPTLQYLAVPVPVKLTPGERELLDEDAAWLRSYGFEWEDFGAGRVLLRAVPSVFGQEGSANMFLELLDRLQDKLSRGDTLLAEQRAALVLGSCKAAVKAHDRLELAEQQALLDQLAEAQAPYTCPHGRPTILRLSYRQLERYFKRVQ